MELIAKKNYKLFILVVIVGIIIAIISSFFISRTLRTMSKRDSRELVIQITDKGFIPNEAYVTKGSNIVWINETEKPQQISSDPYGKSSSLPSLKSNVLSPKGNYAFRFNDAGTFGYHSEFNPSAQGLIKVE